MMPPKLALWLLARRLPSEWRDYVVGDLTEEFTSRAAVSAGAARRWFWRQTLRCLVAPPPLRSTTPIATDRRPSRLGSLLADLRLAPRVLRRAPGYSLGVIAVLALGIGATAATFSIVHAVLLRPLPFPDPDRLVRLFHVPPPAAFPDMPIFPLSPANFYDWKRDAHSFAGMAIYRFRQFTLTGSGEPQSIVAGAVGADFFEVTGVRPELGRVFRRDEDQPGRAHVAVVSHGFWQRHFGGASDVIGRSVRLNGELYEVVGVMPAGLSAQAWGGSGRPLWVPLAYTEAERAVRENHSAQVVARLAPGVSLSQARAELSAIAARLETEFPKENAGWGATVMTLQELIVANVRASLIVLLAAVGLVLLIACANVANLVFARGLARRKEIAVRSALGAGRGRVFQQLLTETVVLALAGGAAGLVFARLGLIAGATLLASQVPRADEIALDNQVLVFVLAVSLLSGVIAGVLPALRAGRADLTSTLKEGGRSEAVLGLRTRRWLIAAEVALSVILLSSAGVMMRSLALLRNTEVGVDPRGVLTMLVNLPATRYDTPEKTHAFFDATLDRLRALPGVQAAGAIDGLPTQGGSVQPIVLEGRAELLPRDQPTVEVRQITPGYLPAMNLPLLRGRDVAASDEETMLVSRSAATLLWGDADPIGRRVTLPLTSRTVLRTVVGIVGDVKQTELTNPAAPTVYQYSRPRTWSSLVLVMKAAVDPHSLVGPATAVIHAIDPERPVEAIQTMDEVLDGTLASRRFTVLLLGGFAAAALLLASIGIYSVLSHLVRGRLREIGIRTALGARSGDVVRLVISEGMLPTVAGIVAGVGGTLLSARLLDRLVFGVSSTDPWTIAAVVVALAGAALVASLAPAYRASRVDPLRILRAS